MMDKEKMINDIVAMLDNGVKRGDGHINVKVNPDTDEAKEVKDEKSVTRGTAECSINPMPCCAPTEILPGDDEE
ncbi:MAG: hypothetical protein KHW49_03315 [Eubacterium sp.]|nr:hypothetical protein [Eubacterium sp.]